MNQTTITRTTSDIAILGAGLAGLAAASRLRDGTHSIALFDARERVGGRVLTIIDADANLPIDMGAEWISNEGLVAPWLRADGTRLFEVSGHHYIRHPGGVDVMDDDEKIAGGLLGRIRTALEADPTIDCSLVDALARWCNDPALEDERNELLGYVQGFHAADPELVSARWLIEVERTQSANASSLRSSAGAADVVRHLQGKLGDAVRTYLSHTVREVRWQAGHVELIMEHDGALHSHTASRLLVTLPLSLLQQPQAEGSVRFTPPLDDAHRGADRLHTGHARRVVCTFDAPFWESLPELPSLSFVQAFEAPLPTWWRVDPPVTPAMVGWAAGPQISALVGANATPEQLRDAAIMSLAMAFGVAEGTVAGHLRQCHSHDWSADPFSAGAYSFVGVGGLDAYEAMRAPIADTLFFAGEATAGHGFNATMEGAIMSGLRAADEMLAPVRHAAATEDAR